MLWTRVWENDVRGEQRGAETNCGAVWGVGCLGAWGDVGLDIDTVVTGIMN